MQVRMSCRPPAALHDTVSCLSHCLNSNKIWALPKLRHERRKTPCPLCTHRALPYLPSLFYEKVSVFWTQLPGHSRAVGTVWTDGTSCLPRLTSSVHDNQWDARSEDRRGWLLAVDSSVSGVANGCLRTFLATRERCRALRGRKVEANPQEKLRLRSQLMQM